MKATIANRAKTLVATADRQKWKPGDLARQAAEDVLALLAQRDALLAACWALLGCAHDPECPNCQDAHRQGHAAIALAEKVP